MATYGYVRCVHGYDCGYAHVGACCPCFLDLLVLDLAFLHHDRDNVHVRVRLRVRVDADDHGNITM